MSYKDNHNSRPKSRTADKNEATFLDLMEELKVNLMKSKDLQALYYNKNVKGRNYLPRILSGSVENISRPRNILNSGISILALLK